MTDTELCRVGRAQLTSTSLAATRHTHSTLPRRNPDNLLMQMHRRMRSPTTSSTFSPTVGRSAGSRSSIDACSAEQRTGCSCRRQADRPRHGGVSAHRLLPASTTMIRVGVGPRLVTVVRMVSAKGMSTWQPSRWRMSLKMAPPTWTSVTPGWRVK